MGLCKLKQQSTASVQGNLLEEAMTIKSEVHGKNKLSFLTKLTLASKVWHLWQEKEKKNFPTSTITQDFPIQKATDDVHDLLSTCHWKTETNE